MCQSHGSIEDLYGVLNIVQLPWTKTSISLHALISMLCNVITFYSYYDGNVLLSAANLNTFLDEFGSGDSIVKIWILCCF